MTRNIEPQRARSRRGSLISAVAGVVVVAFIIAAAIIAAGFDDKQVPVNSSSVWILQTGSQGNRYGQVNTDISELASANSIYSPKELVQSREGALVFTAGMSRFAKIDTANPVEFLENAEYEKAPADTQAVELVGKTLAFVSGDGQVMVSTYDAGQVSQPAAIAQTAAMREADTRFAAVAVVDGTNPFVAGPPVGDTIFAFARSTGKVYRLGPSDREMSEVGSIPGVNSADEFSLSVAGGRWVVLDITKSQLWFEGHSDTAVSVADAAGASPALMKASTGASDQVYVAGSAGLASIAFADGAVSQVVTASGVAARPVVFKGVVYAAWLGEGASGGTMYSSSAGNTSPLDYNGLTLKGTPVPVISMTDTAAVVNETSSGWAWRLPDGALIESTQNWGLVDRTPDQNSSQAEETKVTTPRPPVAERDSFGVRAGALVSLPVLLNDHDPNPGDVLTIDPESVQGLDTGFGSVSVASNEQTLVVRVAAGASGTESFTYKVTDGTAANGLTSNAATVTLRVVGADENTAPQRCADVVQGCVTLPRTNEVAPGGTITIPALDGWVDPEGDRFFIQSATADAAAGMVGFTENGEVVYQNNESGAGPGTSVSIKVRLVDTRGASTEFPLVVSVKEDPTLTLAPLTVTTTVGQPITVNVTRAASGVSGEVRLQSANKQNAASRAVVEKVSDSSFRVQSSDVETVVVAVTLSDGSGDANGIVRVNVIDDATARLSTEPVTVMLSPGRDATVDLFAAAHNPGGRALVLSDVKVTPASGASLTAEPIKAGYLRVRGASADSLPGVLGTVTYTLSDGEKDGQFVTRGQAMVYQLANPASTTPIGVPDSVTVRAGSQTDVDVLANDVGSMGVPLALSATSLKSKCIPGGLIFSGGNKVRVVAPDKPGDFTCSYAMYSAGNPAQLGSALVTIHVVANGTNRKPVPLDLVGRVNAGLVVSIPVDLQNIDPDGDPVSLVSVSATTQGLGFASINEQRNAIVFASTPSMSGQDSFTYTVKDSQGDTATASVHVGVTAAEYSTAPVTTTDFVEIVAQAGKKVVLNPLQNDIDPRGEALTLDKNSVVPDAKTGSTLYTEALARLTGVQGNAITFTASDAPEVLTYRYAVKNASGNRSTGIIVVRISEQVSTYVPEITDTYLTLAQLSALQSGIDVVAQKVSWTSGDIDALTLSIERGDGFSASGHSIRGTAPKDGALVVFSLRGRDYAGTEVVGYGLMHVPSVNDLVLALDPDKVRQQVTENQSVSFDLSKLIPLPSGYSLEVKSDGVKTLGQRDKARCTVESGTTIRYDAGAGSPWRDGCVIPVRARDSQSEFSSVLIPIQVIPEEPEPELARTQLTIVPDSNVSVEFDMTEMTTWYGHDDLSSLQYSYEYSGKYFDITKNGQKLVIHSFGSAPSGVTETVTISVSNHSKTKPAPLVLVVGPATNDNPRGGTITQVCRSSSGAASCAIPTSAIQGGYSPEPDGALTFGPFNFDGGRPNYQSAGNASVCGGVTLRATPTQITVSWSKEPESKRCSGISYHVLDSSGRAGVGTLDFTIQGAPARPASARQTDFTDTTITITVQAGEAALSDPPVTQYVLVDRDGQEYQCDREGADTVTDCEISGLTAWDGRPEHAVNNHSFKVYSKNDVGKSTGYATVSRAYAYQAPSPLTADVFQRVTPVFVSTKTNTTTGVVRARIVPKSDDVVEKYVFTSANQKSTTKVLNDYAPFDIDLLASPGFSSTITVEALGRIAPPVDMPNTSTSSASWKGQVAAAPSLDSAASAAQFSNGDWRLNISAEKLRRNYSQRDGKIAFVAWQSGLAEPRCSWSDASNNLSVTSGNGIHTSIINRPASNVQLDNHVEGALTGLVADKGYLSKVCFTNGFGLVETRGTKVGTVTDPGDGVIKYAVNATPTVSGNGGRWRAEMTEGAVAGKTVEFSSDGNHWYPTLAQAANTFGATLAVHARYCIPGPFCSAGDAVVTPSEETRKWQIDVTGGFQTDQAGNRLTTGLCVPNTNLFFGLSGAGLESGGRPTWVGSKPSEGTTSAEYFDGTTWQPLRNVLSNYRLPSSATATKLRIHIKGNPNVTAVRGLSNELTVEVPCS